MRSDPPSARPTRSGAGTLASLVAGALLLGVLASPFAPPWRLLRSSPFGDAPAEGRVVHFGVGRTASVLVLEDDDGFVLRANGLPEAAVPRRGAPPRGDRFEGWLATLPAVARPGARTMLVVGLGGGRTLEYVPPWIERVDVVELEPEVVAANRSIAALRSVDPLADPRVRIVLGDARSALARTRRRFDVVVSQPSHPWTAGASHLYTREFVASVAAHLEPGGVFVQWMATAFLDQDLLHALAATLVAEFEHVRVYRPRGGLLVFLASAEALEPERRLSEGSPELERALAELGVLCSDDLVAALCLDTAGVRALAGSAQPLEDDRNRLALRAPRLDPVREAAGIEAALGALDPLGPTRASPPAVDRAAVALRCAELGLEARARRLVAALVDPAERALGEGWLAERDGDLAGALDAWRRGRALAPGDARLAYALVRPWLSALAEGHAPPEVLDAAAALPSPALAVVGGWRLSLAGDVPALAALDERLAQARPKDPWYDDATRLRATWRSAGPASDAREAIALLDRLLARRADPLALLVRVRAALAAGAAPEALEAADALARELTQDASRDGVAGFLRRGLVALEPTLATLDPPTRARAVAQRVRGLARP